MHKLPLGTSDFEALRKAGQIYVDKTELVYSLASIRQKFFLARPRRFGKSLLISTFESLFRYGLRDFENLAIEKLWNDSNSYKVLRLDFSEIGWFSTIDEFRQSYLMLLAIECSRLGFKLDSLSNTSILLQWHDWLGTLETSSLVILIDEYDAPLTRCLDNKELFSGVREELARFYSVLKARDRVIRFLFITGITKFNKASIFSALNNLNDISLSPKYGLLLGYTHEEVPRYFEGYLQESAKVLGLDRDALFKELTRQYNGFCFEETAQQKVFTPWSLLKFFAEPERGFRDYWFESGGHPTVLHKYLQSHNLGNPAEYGKEKRISLKTLSDASDLETLTDIGLLTQTGYLTIKAVRYAEVVYVDYPNAEVRRSMAQLYVEQLLRGKVAGQVGAGPIVRNLCEESVEAVVHTINCLFHSIDYLRYPVRDEETLRSFVQVYLAGAGLSPKVEVHNHRGRSDLEVEAGNRHWVFEFKMCEDNEKAQDVLAKALDQMQMRGYGRQYGERDVIALAMVFSKEKREFTAFGSLR